MNQLMYSRSEQSSGVLTISILFGLCMNSLNISLTLSLHMRQHLSVGVTNKLSGLTMHSSAEFERT